MFSVQNTQGDPRPEEQKGAFERLNREIRRRPQVVGISPDGNAALMLVCARPRRAMDAAVHTTTAQKRFLGSIDNGIDGHFRYVVANYFYSFLPNELVNITYMLDY